MLTRPRRGAGSAPEAGSGREIAKPDQVFLLLLVARRELEEARRGAAEDVVLRLLGQEWQVVDHRPQDELPARVVRRVHELGLRFDHEEGALQRLAALPLARLLRR